MSQPEVVTNKQETHPSRRGLRTVGSVALKNAPQAVRRIGEDIAVRRILRAEPFEARLVTGRNEIEKALALEQRVWDEMDYGDLEDYKKYLPQSRIFAAFDDEKCVGMNRLFAGLPEIPPFLENMPIDDPNLKHRLIEAGTSLKVEEYGTVAVVKELRGNSRIFLDLCRLAYRDASERGIETWGIVMEPPRVQQMNRLLGFTFKQIGPAVDYQGGDCAAHIMEFDEVRAHMSTTKPQLYDWFVSQPL